MYDIKTNTFHPVPDDYAEPETKRRKKYPGIPVSSVAFGDVFLLDEYIRKTGLSKVIDAINYRNSDTLHALVAYYVLCSRANSQAAA